MKSFLRKSAYALISILAAGAIMTLFEYINSFWYPVPDEVKNSSVEALQAFTDTLPWTAYILVLLGWTIGSYAAGMIATRFTKERQFKLSLIVGIVLTIIGLANNLLLGHSVLFNVLTLPIFLIFTYAGHRQARKHIK